MAYIKRADQLKLRKYTCATCGEIFTSLCPTARFCPGCRPKAAAARALRYAKRKHKAASRDQGVFLRTSGVLGSAETPRRIERMHSVVGVFRPLHNVHVPMFRKLPHGLFVVWEEGGRACGVTFLAARDGQLLPAVATCFATSR